MFAIVCAPKLSQQNYTPHHTAKDAIDILTEYGIIPLNIRYGKSKVHESKVQRWKSIPCAGFAFSWTILTILAPVSYFCSSVICRSVNSCNADFVFVSIVRLAQGGTPWRRKILARYASAWLRQSRSS